MTQKPEQAEFDQFAADYRQIIDNDRFTKLVGGSFDYFIDLRIGLALDRVADKRASWSAPRVLDFGCGIGAAAARLAERVPGAEVTGLDPSADSVRSAEAMNAARTRFVVSDGLAMPFADETFDLVYSNGTFHHIPHAQHPQILRELFRVTKRGGDLFIFENNPFNPATVLAMKMSPLDREARMVLPPSLRDRVGAAGFRVEAPRYYIFFPGALRALRPVEPYLARVPFGGQYFVRGEKP
ncbi:MAG TPA: class I SAM-dependent methyltransferase [Polyangia bacterium]|nr:class I SAM-dependent methyltransferase [Polyangia bacterium]